MRSARAVFSWATSSVSTGTSAYRPPVDRSPGAGGRSGLRLPDLVGVRIDPTLVPDGGPGVFGLAVGLGHLVPVFWSSSTISASTTSSSEPALLPSAPPVVSPSAPAASEALAAWAAAYIA